MSSASRVALVSAKSCPALGRRSAPPPRRSKGRAARRIGGFAVQHQVVAALGRGQGRGGRIRSRAALGAAADMQGNPFAHPAAATAKRSASSRNGAERVHAGWRARACGDAQARVARVGDEAELGGGRDDRRRAARVEPDVERASSAPGAARRRPSRPRQ